MKRIKSILFILLVTLNSIGFGQLSYEAYQASYIPNYKTISPDWDPVKTYNGLEEGLYGSALLYLFEESQKNKDLEQNIAAILTSAERKKAALGLKELSTQEAVNILGLLKDEWILEIIYFVDKEVYHNLAPNFECVKNFVPVVSKELFGKNNKFLNPVYGAIGFDLAYTKLKGLNTYIDAYNGWTTKIGSDGQLYTLSEPLNNLRLLKGINLSAGFKLGAKVYMDLGFQNRGFKAKGGGVSVAEWNKQIKFSMQTFNLDFMWLKNPQTISFAQGFGLQYNMGKVTEKANFGDEKVQKQQLGEGVSNLGVKYKCGMFINPENSPVMIGILPYLQVNLTKFDFSSVDAQKPQLSFGGGDPADLLSSGTNIGLQVQVAYKFGKNNEKKEYPTFKDEVIASADPKMNTAYSELVPRVSSDGKTLYFVRANHPLNTKGTLASQDIWVSDISKGIENANATHLEKPFNTEKYNSVVSISPDENSMIINGAFKNGVRSEGYSEITRTASGWSAPNALLIKDYAEMSSGAYSSAYMTQDGKHLLLSFSESSTDDYQDLYVSHLLEDGTWSRPTSLGKDLNTAGGENAPFLASDGKTLYYSSNRAGGEGDYDIWFSKRLDDSWTNWSKPENLGSSINTSGFDAYYTIDAKGQYAYMVSTENSKGLEDIIRIKLDKAVQPDPVVLITGKVLNEKTGAPLKAQITYNGLTDGKNYGIARTNPATGEYKMVLPYGVEYDFNAEADNYIGVSERLDLTKKGDYEEMVMDLYLVPIEIGSTIRLNNIFFEFGKSTLKASSYNELNRVVSLLKENKELKIELGGHTDNVGNEVANKKLSQERADACKNYLIDQGIAENRLIAKGYGEEKPISENDTPEGQSRNRRVEFTILEF